MPWTMLVFGVAWGYTGTPLLEINAPDYIPRVGEFIRTDQTPGSYTTRKVVKVEYDYISRIVYIGVLTLD